MGLLGKLLQVPDSLNLVFEHGDEFVREPYILDSRPLHDKAQQYWDEIQKDWLHGPRREFYWYEAPNTLGDMAIWQGVYAAACAWRGGSIAQTSLALEGLEKLVYLGKTNRVCRGADRAKALGGDFLKDTNHTHHVDGEYEFREDPSESSLIGPVFGLWVVMQVYGRSSLGDRAGRLAATLALQIIEDGYVLRNEDGSAATHGDLRPLAAPWQLGTRKPAGLGGLCALLLVAHRGTGQAQFLDRYRELAGAHMDQLTHQETHFLWIHPQYQDVLAYMNYAALIGLDEFNNQRRQAYRRAMWNLWSRTRRQGNSFYAYLTEMSVGGVLTEDLLRARQILQEFNADPATGPTGKQPGRVKLDDAFLAKLGVEVRTWGWKRLRGGKRLASQPLPPSVRPPTDFIWQRSPYTVEGHEDKRYNSLDFLVAYYLGRRINALMEDA